jgi:hypothetical protein
MLHNSLHHNVIFTKFEQKLLFQQSLIKNKSLTKLNFPLKFENQTNN